MNYDLYLVIGLIIVGLSIPAIMAAYSDGRAPRAAAVTLLIGGGLAAFAATQKPGGYDIADIPHAFVRVIGQFIN